MENEQETLIHIKNNSSQCLKQINKEENLNIALYLVSKTVSLLGTNIYNFALALYVLKVTGTGSSFAIIVLIGMLPRIILGPFAGILADRVNRKKLTVTLDIVSGLIVFALLGLSSIYGLKVIFIYITSFILSTINVFYDTSMTSALPSLVTDEKLMKINSYATVSVALSGIAPILAGIIYGFVPIKLFLVINGVSFILSAMLEIFINFSLNNTLDISLKTVMSFHTLKIEIKEVMDFVKEQKVMYSLLKYVLMINFFLSACISVVNPYIINEVLKLSSEQYGILQGCYFIGMIAASIIIGNLKEKDRNIKSLALRLTTIGGILIFIGIPTTGFSIFKIEIVLFIYNIIFLLLLGVVLATINIPILVELQRLTPENLRGRVSGILGILTGGIAPLGIIFAGLIIDKIHPFIILFVSGFSIIAASACLFKSNNT